MLRRNCEKIVTTGNKTGTRQVENQSDQSDQLQQYHSSKVKTGMTGEIAQGLRSHTEDPGLVPSTHMVAQNYL